MKNTGKRIITIFILCFGLIFTAAFSAFAADGSDDNGFTLYKPEFRDAAPNGKPAFNITWSEYPGVDEYELAIYAEGEDVYGRGPFAIRKTKAYYSGSTEGSIILLQGVYTDTVRYRIKARPVFRWNDENAPEEDIWSEIWEINFVNGEYTISVTEEDFDEEIAANTPPKEEKTSTPPPIITPLEHTFPEPLLTYLAKERGMEEPFNADEISSFSVTVWLGEAGGAPTQRLTDEETVEEFRNAVRNIIVEGKEDDMVIEDGGGTSYSAVDKDGNTMFAFTIQYGTLERNDGHYTVSGLNNLPTDKIMTEDDWYEYWGTIDEIADEYMRGIDPEGMSLLDAASYATHMMNKAGSESVYSLYVYIDWNKDAGQLRTSDPAEIIPVMEGLSQVKVGKKTSDYPGQMWHISFGYSDPEDPFADSAWLGFCGQCVKIDSTYYELENADAFYDSLDCDILNYLKNFADKPKVDPTY